MFFIDKCLGLIVVPSALRSAGLHVELKTDHFADNTPDVDWLAEVGRRGWVILSKDKNLRHNHLEIVGLLQSGTHSFILTSGNFTGTEMAQALVSAIPDMLKMIAKFSPPMVAAVSKSGACRVHWTFDDLLQRVSTKQEDN